MERKRHSGGKEYKYKVSEITTPESRTNLTSGARVANCREGLDNSLSTYVFAGPDSTRRSARPEWRCSSLSECHLTCLRSTPEGQGHPPSILRMSTGQDQSSEHVFVLIMISSNKGLFKVKTNPKI